MTKIIRATTAVFSACLAVPLISPPTWAGTEAPGMQFLLLKKDMRAAGMGDAYTALSDDAGALFANPAGMVFLDKTHIQAGINKLGGDLENLSQAALIYPDKNFNNAWGLHAAQLNLSYPSYNEYGHMVYDRTTDTNLTFGLSYAHQLGLHWALGLSAQYAKELLNSAQLNGLPKFEASGFFGTLGLIYASESDRWRLGAMAYNMGAVDWKWKNSGDLNNCGPDGCAGAGSKSEAGILPYGLRFGLARRMFADKNLTITLDRDQAAYSNGASFNLGAEWRISKTFDLRGGARMAKELLTPTFGLGLRVGRIVIDLAAAPASNQINSMGMSLAWWFPPKAAAEDEPVHKVTTGGKKLNIAVADMRSVNVAETDAATVTEFVRTALVNTGLFRLVDRGNMEKILAEQKFQASGCTTEECAVQMGKLLNVQKIVTGTVSNLKGTYYLQASVMDVEKGEIEVSQGAEAGSVKELKSAAGRLAKKIESAYR